MEASSKKVGGGLEVGKTFPSEVSSEDTEGGDATAEDLMGAFGFGEDSDAENEKPESPNARPQMGFAAQGKRSQASEVAAEVPGDSRDKLTKEVAAAAAEAKAAEVPGGDGAPRPRRPPAGMKAE